jgi:hypothetical protein
MNSPERGRQPVAYGLREIRLNEGVSQDAFEKFILETFFPTVDTSQVAPDAGFGRDQHFLLQRDWPSTVYVWMSRVEYQVHQTPFPTWLFNRFTSMYDTAQEPLAPFGTVSEELQVLYDVGSTGGRFS